MSVPEIEVTAESKVKRLDGSDVFHYTREREATFHSDRISLCGGPESRNNTTDVEELPLGEALDDGTRPCKQCKRWLPKYLDDEILECRVCGRFSVLIDDEMVALEGYEVNICVGCIDRIRELDY